MEAKKQLAGRITARFHREEDALEARNTFEQRRSARDPSAGAGEVARGALPPEPTVLTLTAACFKEGFGMEKSNSELKKQFIATGAVQLNGKKLTDPNAAISPQSGDILRLSKKHSVRIA